MLKSRALLGALIVASVALASVFAAAPASAATLPAGQRITVVDQYSTQFYTADTDASLTTAGPADLGIDGCAQGIDVDNSGLGFAVASAFPWFSYNSNCQNDGALSAALWKADANTGLFSDGLQVRIFLDEESIPNASECSAIDLSGGIITAACLLADGDSAITYVGTVDPLTGILTPDFVFGDDDEFIYLIALAKDPVAGVLYAFSQEESDGLLFGVLTLSVTDGVDYVGSTTDPIWGADFDSSGQLWASTQDPGGNPALATIVPVGGEFPSYDFYTIDEIDYVEATEGGWIEPLTVWGVVSESAPQLAATGSTVSPVIPVGAAALLLVGALLAAGTTMRRRATQR